MHKERDILIQSLQLYFIFLLTAILFALKYFNLPQKYRWHHKIKTKTKSYSKFEKCLGNPCHWHNKFISVIKLMWDFSVLMKLYSACSWGCYEISAPGLTHCRLSLFLWQTLQLLHNMFSEDQNGQPGNLPARSKHTYTHKSTQSHIHLEKLPRGRGV